MEKLLRGVSALFLVVFLSACPSGDTPNPTDEPSGQVANISLQMDPNRKFNNGPILITLSTATPDVDIFYTLDRSAPSATNGIRYTGPFHLTADDTNDADYRGYVVLRTIGIKAGLRDSSINSQSFQIFPNEPIKDDTGNVIPSVSATGIGVGGHYSTNQNILVTVTVTNGVITAIYQNGYNNTTSHTNDYWAAATAHANQFLSTMNSWEFDTVTGASFSSRAIKDGLGKAMAQILD
jgi:uncharacterized protein with FMN-binding domain